MLPAVVTPGAKVKVIALDTLPPDSKHSFLTTDITNYGFMLNPWKKSMSGKRYQKKGDVLGKGSPVQRTAMVWWVKVATW